MQLSVSHISTNDTASISPIRGLYPSCAHDCQTELLRSCAISPDFVPSSSDPSSSTASVFDPADLSSSILTCLCSPDPSHRPNITSCFPKSCLPRPITKALNTTATLCHDTSRNRSSDLVALTITFGIISSLFVIAHLAFRLLTHPSGRLGLEKCEQTRTGNTVIIPAWTPATITIVLGFWIMAGSSENATVISIIRLTLFIPSKDSALRSALSNYTQEYYAIPLWSVVEYHVAVICACLPAMRQLLVRAFPRLESDGGNDACAGDGGGAGTGRNVPRSGTHQHKWPACGCEDLE
ncbi:hypothetical protein QBC45DRAFT_391735 [Copromyces sp. CBS 386.78]|nr:hypothetical protein QBC45DRAFT_391735 [Copromyces sp. CBS 386.78]